MSPLDPPSQLDPERVALAFLIAPGATAFAVSCGFALSDPNNFAGMMFFGTMIGSMVAYPSALILGVPAYLLLRRRVRPYLLIVMAVGGLMVAIPFAVFGLLVGLSDRLLDDATRVVGVAGMAAVGWALGCLGGLIFWLCAYSRPPSLSRLSAMARAVRGPASPRTSDAGEPPRTPSP